MSSTHPLPETRAINTNCFANRPNLTLKLCRLRFGTQLSRILTPSLSTWQGWKSLLRTSANIYRFLATDWLGPPAFTTTMAAYTAERLQLALQLFPYIPGAQTKIAGLKAPKEPYYELRERKQRIDLITTWLDDDKDEDYDPSEDKIKPKRKSPSTRRHRAPPRPAKRRKSEDAESAEPELISAHASDTSDAPVISPSSPLSEPETDSWDTYWAIDSDCDDSGSPYKLRTRKKPVRPKPEVMATSPGEEESGPGDDEEGSTFEGCQGCRELDLPCSMADDQSHYPCQNCRDDGIDCEISPAPKWKRACEQCRSGRRRGSCSYNSLDYDHSLPCQACQQHGFKCVAGPARLH